MEWWGELASILERRTGPVMHALAFVELNGINLAPLLRRFSSRALMSSPTSLILETRLHRYSPKVQDGLLTLVLAQLRRLPAALVVDFVLAFADSRPSPMTGDREWTRRLVCRICQQLKALDPGVSFPLRLQAILQAADEAEEDERFKVGADVLSLAHASESEDEEGDGDEPELVVEVSADDEIVQEVEWDMDILQQPQRPANGRKQREQAALKRKRKRDRAAPSSKRRKGEAEDANSSEDEGEQEGEEDQNENDEDEPRLVEVLDVDLSSDERSAEEEEEGDKADQERAQDMQEESLSQPAAITAEVADQVVALRGELDKLGQEGKADISNRSALDLEEVCELLRPHELADESLTFLCGQLFSVADISYKRCRTLVQCLLLPKVQRLERSISRILSSAIIAVAKQHPSTLTDALLLPLVLAPALGVPQSDVVNRVLKECFDLNSVLQFFKTFLGSCESGEDESFSLSQSLSQSQDAGSGVTWTENTVVVLQAVVDMRGMILPDDAFELLLVQLDRHAAYFAASLKFAALMMSLITKHAKQVAKSKDYVVQIVDKGTTFMKKATMARLAKL